MRDRAVGDFARRLCLGCLAVTVLTLVCYRAQVDLATAIPLYLLVVVGHSLAGDFRSSVLVATFSAACLDFFFTEPTLSFYMRNPLNGLALVAFIVTALVITKLVTRLRQEAALAKSQGERIERLYQLSQQLAGLSPDTVMTDRFLDPFRRLFGVSAICVFDGETAEVRLVGHSEYGLADRTREAYIGGRDTADAQLMIATCCLRAGAGPVRGAIGFEGVRDPAETIGSLAGITAALIERAKAFQSASAAAVATQAEIYRSAMLDALAHEFQTPLAVILAAAGGLREAGPLVAEQQEFTETVENEAARLGGLTSRLLRTARLDREDLNPRMEWTDLSALASQVVRQYGSRSTDRTVQVHCDSGDAEARVDPEMLRIALSQLVENACKYSGAGSTITVALERRSDAIAIRVTNTGSSIPVEERYRVFDRFYRGVDVKRSTPGSGLGLYVARKIASAHGGALELEPDDPAEGRVTFCLSVPIPKEATKHVFAAE